MAPDFVWLKIRSGAGDHYLADTLRGISTALYTNNTDAERTESGRGITSFNSNGFGLGLDPALRGSTNLNGATYVGWQWNAGGSTVTNTSGSISSQVRANPSAGFSIVTYTGTGSVSTVGHGLGVAPRMIIVKRRDSATNGDWFTYTATTGNGNVLFLNLTNASSASGGAWNNTSPTSSVFTVGTSSGVNANGSTYVAYCFSEVAGYSRFGSYTGNGSADGPFVFCGFRPRFIMLKRTDSTSDWAIFDTARNTVNISTNAVFANLSMAELTGENFDILSNGFKLRAAPSWGNISNGTYIYMAFAENSFKYSLAR